MVEGRKKRAVDGVKERNRLGGEEKYVEGKEIERKRA